MTTAAVSRTCLIAAVAAMVCLPGMAMAAAGDAPRIGVTTTVKGKVAAAVGQSAPHEVRSGEDVVAGERFTTAAGGSAAIQFRDQSTFELGPNASVTVNPLDIKPVEGSSVKSVMVETGAFRLITGPAAGTSQTIIGTHLGAFTSHSAVVVGQVTPQRVVMFPIDGPANFTYPSGSLDVPRGGALIAESDTGRAVAVEHVAGDAATTALMAEAMNQLGAAPSTAQQQAVATTSVGYIDRPVGAMASAAADGFINSNGGTLSKAETPPETEVKEAQQAPPQTAPPAPTTQTSFPVPPLPPPPFASTH